MVKQKIVVKLDGIQAEVVVLRAIQELIDAIVNYEVLSIGPADPTEVRFKSATHAKYFNVMLVDLLSVVDEKGFIEPKPFLRLAKEITESPCFNIDDSVNELAFSVDQFRVWLNEPFERKDVWLSSLDICITLKMTRLELIKVGGNICRHNFLRAFGVAEDAKRILEKSGVKVLPGDALSILEELNHWLHDQIFRYHVSAIAEHLNRIRWGIFTYLGPEFARSFTNEGGTSGSYRYDIPDGIESDFAKTCYWELMNGVRARPIIRRFEVPDILKQRY